MAKTKTEAKGQVTGNAAPDFLEEEAGQGYSDMGGSLPRLVILQTNSTATNEADTDNYIPGAKPGMFYNTALKKLYGNKVRIIPIRVVPVWFLSTEAENGAMGDFRGKVAPFSVPYIGDLFVHAVVAEGEKKDLVIAQGAELFCFVEGDIAEGMVVLTIKKGGMSYLKDFEQKIRGIKLKSGKSQPFYGTVWELETKLNTNPKNPKQKWFDLGLDRKSSATPVRWITSSDKTDYIDEALELVEMAIQGYKGGSHAGGEKLAITDGSDY